MTGVQRPMTRFNRSTVFACALLCALAFRPAFSQADPYEAEHPFPPDTSSAPIPAPAGKSVLLAYGLALGATFIPYGLYEFNHPSNGWAEFGLTTLSGVGLFGGPSAGEFYAEGGPTFAGSVGMAIRAVGVGFFIASGVVDVNAGLSSICANPDPSRYLFLPFGDLTSCPDTALYQKADHLATTGEVLFIGGMIYSLIDTYFAVQRGNAAKEEPARRFGWSPELAPANDGGLKPGVTAWVKF